MAQVVNKLLTISHLCKADSWRWLIKTIVDVNREVGLLAGKKRKSAVSLFVLRLWRKLCSMKRLQFLGRQWVTHFQSWANTDSPEISNKMIVENNVENEISSLVESSLFIGFLSQKQVSKDFRWTEQTDAILCTSKKIKKTVKNKAQDTWQQKATGYFLI